MTFFGPNSPSFGAARAQQFSGGQNRREVLGQRYAPFANPFFDHASTYTPPSVKQLFGFCRFYFLTHGIINSICSKAAEYPITDVIFQHSNKNVVRKWEDLLLGEIDYRTLQLEINLDYYVQGNAFLSPSFPFSKKLICKSCNNRLDAVEYKKSWRYTNHKFWLECPKCGQRDYASATDEYHADPYRIRFTLWNPENINITYNETTGAVDYTLDLSPSFKNMVTMGKKELVATTPQIFLEAIQQKRMLVMDPKMMFHMRRPAISSGPQSKGWGIPLLMPVLKDAFYMQVMKKAQESVLMTHMTPQVFLFPQPATGGADPFSITDLSKWREKLNQELARQRMDPSYYGVLPFPIGHQIIGENGRSLLLMPEIRAAAELICIGMGFPSNLFFDSGTYAGNNVTMRMLENFFLSNVMSHYRLLHWNMRRIGGYVNWEVPDARFKPFKMADDIQRQAFAFQLNQAGKLSDTTLLSMADFNAEEETELQRKEVDDRMEALKKSQTLMAEIQGESSTIMARYQAKAQQEMQDAQQRAAQKKEQTLERSAAERGMTPFEMSQRSNTGQQEAGVSALDVVSSLASQVQGLPPEQRQQYLENLRRQDPRLAAAVHESTQQSPVQPDARPQPEVLPPRR